MTSSPPQHRVLITGPVDPDGDEREAARQVGAMLAREGYGLIVGDWPGVDELTLYAFLGMVAAEDHASHLTHVDNYSKRESPFRVAGAEVLPNNGPDPGYSTAAVQAAHAGIIVSGRRGSRDTMDALLRLGKPVLPVAFLGWDAFEVFRDVLRSWGDSPVPGLTDRQFMELIRPWRFGAKTVARLLNAALTVSPRVFVSYRHEDVPAAAGRIFDELAHVYGGRTVYIDYDKLRVGDEIDGILKILSACSLMILVIGPNWRVDRLREPSDYVRREIEVAIDKKLKIIPVLVQREQGPLVEELPDGIAGIHNLLHGKVRFEEWQRSMARLVESVDDVILQH